MALRAMVFAQVVWVALIGAYCRGALGSGSERVMPYLIPLLLPASLLAVLALAGRTPLTQPRAYAIGITEAAVCLAYVVALLPAVQ